MRRPPPTDPPALAGVSVMAKPTGPRCNLECTYCYYREKETLHPARPALIMSGEVLESFVRQMLADPSGPRVGFCWQGGEPTLAGLAFFREAVRLQEKHRGGREVDNALQTNGVGLDDEWCAFLRDQGFLVGISIDGPEPRHDRFRVSGAREGSFAQVMRAVDCLRRHGVPYNTITAVQADNAQHPLEVYRFLRQISAGHMQFIPVVERLAPARAPGAQRLARPTDPGAARVAPWSVEPRVWGEFLCTIFDEWVRQDVGRCYIQLFETALESWLGLEPSLCAFASTCGRALVIEHDGALYPCDHYVYPDTKLGNILDQSLASLMGSEAQRSFGAQKLHGLPQQCVGCAVRFACNGGCPKHRFATTPTGEPGLSYLCAGYQRFFGHIAPYMRFMASELLHQRPPANVMPWARARDPAAP